MIIPLDYPTEAEIGWLFDQGVSDTAMLESAPIRAANVEFYPSSRNFDFVKEGERALIFTEDHDLIAWQPKRNVLASWCAVAFALNENAIWNPASYFMGTALRVHCTPLDWLRAEREGICIAQPRLTYAFLRHARTLAIADPIYAQQVKRWLRPPKSEVKIFIEVQKEDVAA
jgi:hypothetical protein